MKRIAVVFAAAAAAALALIAPSAALEGGKHSLFAYCSTSCF